MKPKILLCLFSAALISTQVFANTCRDFDSRIKADGSFKMLDLSNCNISDNDVAAIVDYANNNGYKFNYLNLSNNQLHSESAKGLATLRFVERLNVDNNFLGDEGVHVLVKNVRISDLEIGNNQLTEAG